MLVATPETFLAVRRRAEREEHCAPAAALTTKARQPFQAARTVRPPHFPLQPKGRAMKRLKYNRRFVNVVVGFGKKR